MNGKDHIEDSTKMTNREMRDMLKNSTSTNFWKIHFQIPFFLVSREHLLDLGNGTCRIQTLGASPCAVENRVAAVNAHAVVQGVLALGSLLISRVDQPTVRLEKDRRAEILLAVPPV